MDKLNKARRVDDHKAFNVEARGGCWAYSLMACVLSVAHATPQPGISTRLCNTVPIGKVMAADRLREALLRKAIYELFMAAAAAIGNHVVDDVVADFIKHNMENELTELIYEDTPNLWQTCSSSSHGGWGGSCVLLLAMVALRLSHVFVIDTSILMERTPVTHLSVEWDGNSPVSMQQRPIYMSRDHAEAASVKHAAKKQRVASPAKESRKTKQQFTSLEELVEANPDSPVLIFSQRHYMCATSPSYTDNAASRGRRGAPLYSAEFKDKVAELERGGKIAEFLGKQASFMRKCDVPVQSVWTADQGGAGSTSGSGPSGEPRSSGAGGPSGEPRSSGAGPSGTRGSRLAGRTSGSGPSDEPHSSGAGGPSGEHRSSGAGPSGARVAGRKRTCDGSRYVDYEWNDLPTSFTVILEGRGIDSEMWNANDLSGISDDLRDTKAFVGIVQSGGEVPRAERDAGKCTMPRFYMDILGFTYATWLDAGGTVDFRQFPLGTWKHDFTEVDYHIRRVYAGKPHAQLAKPPSWTAMLTAICDDDPDAFPKCAIGTPPSGVDMATLMGMVFDELHADAIHRDMPSIVATAELQKEAIADVRNMTEDAAGNMTTDADGGEALHRASGRTATQHSVNTVPQKRCDESVALAWLSHHGTFVGRTARGAIHTLAASQVERAFHIDFRHACERNENHFLPVPPGAPRAAALVQSDGPINLYVQGDGERTCVPLGLANALAAAGFKSDADMLDVEKFVITAGGRDTIAELHDRFSRNDFKLWDAAVRFVPPTEELKTTLECSPYPKLVNLLDSKGNAEHTVGYFNGYIFDAVEAHAMPLTRSSLDKCCVPNTYAGVYRIIALCPKTGMCEKVNRIMAKHLASV